MSFKMKGFNKPKNIDDSSIFKSKTNLMIRNAALFQAGKEVAGRKSYFQYDDDGNITAMRYQSNDQYDDGTGFFTPKEISARYHQKGEGAYYDKREDGTNKFSDHRGGINYADDAKTIITGYTTDDGKFNRFQRGDGVEHIGTRDTFKGRAKRELEDFERKYAYFNRQRANERENARRMKEYADAGGKLSRKPSERYIPWEEKKKLMEKNNK